LSNRRRLSRPPASQRGYRGPDDIETARANALVARQVADQAAADLARLEAAHPAPEAHVPDTTVTAQLDQLAATINAQRVQPHVQALGEYEQRMLAELLAAFPDVEQTTIGAILLYHGGRLAQLGSSLPDPLKPHVGPILCNLTQMCGERLWTGQPPVVWHCPHTLVGGKACPKVLTARDEEQLAPRVAGHLELSHPDTRAERRA